MTSEKRFQVFISSTYADLKNERDAITRAIMELGSIPAGMEAFPAADEEQFEFIKKVIDDSDYYVVILAARYGSMAEDGIGYTEKEYNYALSTGMPILAFVHENPTSFTGALTDLGDNKKAQNFYRFREMLLNKRMAKLWAEPGPLVTQVVLSLSRAFQTKPRPGWVRGDRVATSEVLEELSALQKENIELEKKLRSQLTSFDLKAPTRDLEAKIDLVGSYKHRYNERYNYEKEVWTVKVSFKELFQRYSPSFAESLNVETLTSFIASDYSNSSGKTGDVINLTTSRDTMNQIRVQFEALNLIEVFQATTVSKTVGTFWRLTEGGRQLMLALNVRRAGG